MKAVGPGQLGDTALRNALLQRSSTAQTKKRRSGKSVLAVLLFEAHRRQLFKAWDYASLGKFAADELSIPQATFAKYKKAGKAVSDFKPKLYDEVIGAVANGKAEPTLPEVSALAELPSIRKRLGAKQAAEAIDLVFDGGGLRHTRGLSQLASYGASSPAQREVLQQLDAFVVECGRVQELLTSLANAKATRPQRDLLHDRLLRIQDACVNAHDLAGGLIR